MFEKRAILRKILKRKKFQIKFDYPIMEEIVRLWVYIWKNGVGKPLFSPQLLLFILILIIFIILISLILIFLFLFHHTYPPLFLLPPSPPLPLRIPSSLCSFPPPPPFHPHPHHHLSTAAGGCFIQLFTFCLINKIR